MVFRMGEAGPRRSRLGLVASARVARVGMRVTRGSRDILEIGGPIRSRLYDVHLLRAQGAIVVYSSARTHSS